MDYGVEEYRVIPGKGDGNLIIRVVRRGDVWVIVYDGRVKGVAETEDIRVQESELYAGSVRGAS
jgi:hypothetical protein